jgi:hypothetical protein
MDCPFLRIVVVPVGTSINVEGKSIVTRSAGCGSGWLLTI